MAVGTVKWFNATKGFGFIMPQDGGKDVFVHITAVQAAGLTGLNDGQKVSYEVAMERWQGGRYQPAPCLTASRPDAKGRPASEAAFFRSAGFRVSQSRPPSRSHPGLAGPLHRARFACSGRPHDALCRYLLRRARRMHRQNQPSFPRRSIPLVGLHRVGRIPDRICRQAGADADCGSGRNRRPRGAPRRNRLPLRPATIAPMVPAMLVPMVRGLTDIRIGHRIGCPLLGGGSIGRRIGLRQT